MKETLGEVISTDKLVMRDTGPLPFTKEKKLAFQDAVRHAVNFYSIDTCANLSDHTIARFLTRVLENLVDLQQEKT